MPSRRPALCPPCHALPRPESQDGRTPQGAQVRSVRHIPLGEAIASPLPSGSDWRPSLRRPPGCHPLWPPDDAQQGGLCTGWGWTVFLPPREAGEREPGSLCLKKEVQQAGLRNQHSQPPRRPPSHPPHAAGILGNFGRAVAALARLHWLHGLLRGPDCWGFRWGRRGLFQPRVCPTPRLTRAGA